ncbi:fibronectin type III domain-containing protein [Spirillospora sp. NPDC047418]
MTATAPNVIVAGHPDLARKLRTTGRFPAVFDVASATALRELSESSGVASPATFMFAPDFDEDLPDASVAVLANGLAASGFAVIVHDVFTEHGDVFDPRVISGTGPLTMAELLTILARPAAPAAPPDRPPSEPPPPPVPDADLNDLAEYGPLDDAEEDLQDVPALAVGHGPVESLEPENPAEWMWKETEPEPDHYAGLPPESGDRAAMPPESGRQGWPPPGQGAAGSRGRGRIVLIAAAVFVLLAGLMGAALLAVGPRRDEARPEAATSSRPSPASPVASPASAAPSSSAPSSQGTASQVPTSTPTAVRPADQYKPTGVRIVDSRISIEVSWKDRNGGKAVYYVVGGPVGQTPSTLANTERGATKVVVAALNPSVEYCLTVVAVVDVDRIAYAQPVCTHRGKHEG